MAPKANVMEKADSSKAQQIARAARAFEQDATGRLPSSITVVLTEDTLVITLRGTLSPAETALAKSREGTAGLREFHRQLFNTTSEPLRQEIRRITGVEVREAVAEMETLSGTAVLVFSLAAAVSADTWRESCPDSAGRGEGFERWDDEGGRRSE